MNNILLKEKIEDQKIVEIKRLLLFGKSYNSYDLTGREENGWDQSE